MIGRLCIAHPDHAGLVPIEIHHVRPLARGGQGERGVQLCANAHGLVHDLLDRIEAEAERSPYAVTHEVVRRISPDIWAAYPGAVRVIAYKGWLTYGPGFLGGLYAERYRMWDSAGRPKRTGVPVYADMVQAARWARHRQPLPQ